MFEPAKAGEFTNFNGTSVRISENFFIAVIFWYFCIKTKVQKNYD